MDPTTRWTFDIQIPVSDFSTITTLIPYYTSSTTMFVLVGDGTNSAVYALGIPAGGSTIAASLVGNSFFNYRGKIKWCSINISPWVS
jgi:hypothetical protein